VRPGMIGFESAENLRFARVGNVKDRRAVRSVLMTDISIISVDDDLPSPRKLHPAEMANVGRCARRSAGIVFSGRQNFDHAAPFQRIAGDCYRRKIFLLRKIAHLEPCNSYCWLEVSNGGFRGKAALSNRRFLSSAPEHYWQEQIERLRCNGKKCDTERPICTAEQ
jgi:hypothetical protein